MTIEVLYFDGCPNHDKLLSHLPLLLKHEGVTAEIVLLDIPDADCAIKERFLGSPTLRVDGHDIDPGARQRDDYGLKCRLYHTPPGSADYRPTGGSFDAIAARRATHARD